MLHENTSSTFSRISVARIATSFWLMSLTKRFPNEQNCKEREKESA